MAAPVRFALDHAPAAPRRSFWLRVALVFLLLAAPLTAFNLAVDPFDFRFTPHLPLVRSAIMPKNDTALWMAGEMRRIPQSALDEVTLVFAGDSRTDSLVRWRTTARLLKVGRNDQVLNLSYGGASFEDTCKVISAELPHLPRLRALVVGMSYENIGGMFPSRAGNALRLKNAPLLYALNLGTFSWSMRLLREQSDAIARGILPERPEAFDPAGIPRIPRSRLDPAANIARAEATRDVAPTDSVRDLIAEWAAGTFADASPDLIRKKLQTQVAPFVADLRARGLAVVFFLPPLRPELLADLSPAQVAAVGGFSSDLAKIAPVEDFSRGSRDGIPLRFLDHAHVNASVAQAIFSDIYLRHFSTRPAASAPAPAGAGH